MIETTQFISGLPRSGSVPCSSKIRAFMRPSLIPWR